MESSSEIYSLKLSALILSEDVSFTNKNTEILLHATLSRLVCSQRREN
jgi:hypothetical protein